MNLFDEYGYLVRSAGDLTQPERRAQADWERMSEPEQAFRALKEMHNFRRWRDASGINSLTFYQYASATIENTVPADVMQAINISDANAVPPEHLEFNMRRWKYLIAYKTHILVTSLQHARHFEGEGYQLRFTEFVPEDELVQVDPAEKPLFVHYHTYTVERKIKMDRAEYVVKVEPEE